MSGATLLGVNTNSSVVADLDSISITKPTTAVGDLLVALIYGTDTASEAVATPDLLSGWTNFATGSDLVNGTSTRFGWRMMGRIADGSEGSSISFTFTPAGANHSFTRAGILATMGNVSSIGAMASDITNTFSASSPLTTTIASRTNTIGRGTAFYSMAGLTAHPLNPVGVQWPTGVTVIAEVAYGASGSPSNNALRLALAYENHDASNFASEDIKCEWTTSSANINEMEGARAVGVLYSGAAATEGWAVI